MALPNLRLRRDREGNNMAINSKFDKLITSLRTAQIRKELHEEATSQ